MHTIRQGTGRGGPARPAIRLPTGPAPIDLGLMVGVAGPSCSSRVAYVAVSPGHTPCMAKRTWLPEAGAMAGKNTASNSTATEREWPALTVRLATVRGGVDDLLDRVAGLRAIRLRQLAAARSGPPDPAGRRVHARLRRGN